MRKIFKFGFGKLVTYIFSDCIFLRCRLVFLLEIERKSNGVEQSKVVKVFILFLLFGKTGRFWDSAFMFYKMSSDANREEKMLLLLLLPQFLNHFCTLP